MIDIFVNIFVIIGAILSIIGALFIIFFGFIIGYDLIYDAYNNFKLKLLQKDFHNEKRMYIVSQLEDLKERYPDLEIDYKIK